MQVIDLNTIYTYPCEPVGLSGRAARCAGSGVPENGRVRGLSPTANTNSAAIGPVSGFVRDDRIGTPPRSRHQPPKRHRFHLREAHTNHHGSNCGSRGARAFPRAKARGLHNQVRRSAAEDNSSLYPGLTAGLTARRRFAAELSAPNHTLFHSAAEPIRRWRPPLRWRRR